RNWRTDWARYVTEFSPDVVVMMVGSWEVFDRRIGGELLKFGQPAYDAYLRGLLDEAVGILSAGGAKVVVATQPSPTMARDPGAPREWWDEPDGRFAHVNELLRGLAAAHPDTTLLIDLAAKVCPTTPCPPAVEGVRTRDDGVHYGASGGPFVAGWLGPQLRQLDLSS
ncbi:MAG TPA: hypothetical protein VJM33_11630, partial [Microthrixaceae bacterium]|nr:hypothetical protein [Microthrixaceae bacterium]